MKMILDGTPSEINRLIELLNFVSETEDDVVVVTEKPELKTGYDVEQEDLSYLTRWKFSEDYKGFRVYSTGSGSYGFTTKDFDARVNSDSIDLCRTEIDMVIKKMNR